MAERLTSLFKRSPTHQYFHRFHATWTTTLSGDLLPLLRHSMLATSPPSLLPSASHSLFLHLCSYYDALDSAATSSSLPHLLFHHHRSSSSLESPFLWLGHLHPYLFTTLLRSFIDQEEEKFTDSDIYERNWEVVTAWGNCDKRLTARIDQIECGLRLMVPALVARIKEAQAGFVRRIGMEWGRGGKRVEVGEAMEAEMEAMASVYVSANRLRRSILADIMSALDAYQGAVFLEGLGEFLVGFGDRGLVSEFERCKVAIN